ncbi:DNA-binding protein [Vibrio sp. HN007]|uniref:baseplate complex protein n=1 Tax=Vibrio iocasae TaxID=3098914 RepID=UPI0035D49174
MLSLDGEVLKLDSMRVSMNMELKDQDMSGQSSGTNRSEQGDKGKKLSFSGRVPFGDDSVLTRLYELASQKDASGSRKIYRIGNTTARSLKIREVKFTGNIRADENESLMAWNVSFELREHSSVAEQREIREKAQNKPEQQQNTRMQEALSIAKEATE